MLRRILVCVVLAISIGNLVPVVAYAAPPIVAPAMTAKLFRLKHQSSNDVIKPLRALASGAKGSKLDETSAFESIAIFDYPANVSAVADAIRLLDTPTADVSLRLHVLLADNDGASSVPKGLARVVEELSRSFDYRAYHELVVVTQRVRSGSWMRAEGEALLPTPLADETSPLHYEMKVQASASKAVAKPAEIVLRGVEFEGYHKQIGKVEINTDLTIRSGETVVVGTATIKSRAVVLVISGEIKP
ncbi:MAG: hypothetical protein SGI86_11450 [Deltaproteobacteria bacterium]|nr:hypothetical protein [Deltaproteobacteria bacterium]